MARRLPGGPRGLLPQGSHGLAQLRHPARQVTERCAYRRSGLSGTRAKGSKYGATPSQHQQDGDGYRASYVTEYDIGDSSDHAQLTDFKNHFQVVLNLLPSGDHGLGLDQRANVDR